MVAPWLRLAIATCIATTVFACGSTDKMIPSNEKGSATVADDASLESISNPVYADNIVRFSVISNGCTSTTDFSVGHSVDNNRCELSVQRTTPDLCRRASTLIDIQLEWPRPSSCAEMDIVFLNPVLDELALRTLVPSLERKLDTER